jgi:hypothetical protein
MKRLFLLIGAGLVFGGLPRAEAEILTAPAGLSTVRAYPNPWRGDRDSAIPLIIDRLPANAVATVKIFTIAGEHVRTLAGTGGVAWDMRNDSGQNVASGIYLYLVQAGAEQKTGKIAVIR